MRILVGMIIGLVAGAGGTIGYRQLQLSEDPCRGHCGVGTGCVEGVCIAEKEEVTKRSRKRRGRRRGRRRGQRPGGADTALLRTPTAADLKTVAQGPALSGTDYVNMGEESAGRELSSAEVDGAVRRLDPKVVACIDRARGDYQIDSGKVVVGFRIERSGAVRKVRVSAPALLMRAGLHGCLAPLFAGLRFGPTTRSLVMSYPYALQ